MTRDSLAGGGLNLAPDGSVLVRYRYCRFNCIIFAWLGEPSYEMGVNMERKRAYGMASGPHEWQVTGL